LLLCSDAQPMCGCPPASFPAVTPPEQDQSSAEPLTGFNAKPAGHDFKMALGRIYNNANAAKPAVAKKGQAAEKSRKLFVDKRARV
jgi:hypothetical protein